MFEDGKYVIYKNNMLDNSKNEEKKIKRPDRLFDEKFKELNGLSLRQAFGFSDKMFKRNIPKQFYYIDQSRLNKVLVASSIDASSQYPSGCLGRLPDFHDTLFYKGRVEPNEEYPFAFYASGHCAEYGVFDTHTWTNSVYQQYLFRFDKSLPWPFRSLTDEQEETILVKASKYTMDSTWQYFYDAKTNFPKGSIEYELAKLIMNAVIGCWHRKDKDQKAIMTYDDHGSYQLAHIVAIAIARGNQKILNMVNQIDHRLIVHICVDGIIYMGSDEYGITESKLGIFSQEFTGAQIVFKGINCYCARKDGHCVKFKHAGFDLLDGKEIDESRDFQFEDLNNLGCKEHTINIWEDQ